MKSDNDLPECELNQVCNKIDTYSTPWIQKSCRCHREQSPCSLSLNPNDGYTIIEKNKQYKVCIILLLLLMLFVKPNFLFSKFSYVNQLLQKNYQHVVIFVI